MEPWRKSSSSGLSDCIEAASWRKPRRSVNNGACVEIGDGPAVVGVRDSKLGDDSPVLKWSPDAWRAFTEEVKAL